MQLQLEVPVDQRFLMHGEDLTGRTASLYVLQAFGQTI